MTQTNCPSCGARVELNEEKATLFCPYCGGKMPQEQDALDKIIRHRENTQKFKEEVRQRKVEEEKQKRSGKSMVIMLIMLALLAAGIIFGIQGENNSEKELQAIVTEIQADVAAGNYDEAMVKTEKLYWPHSDTKGIEKWDKQREGLQKVIQDAKESAGK